MTDFWLAFWLFLPAGLANMMPVFINKIPLINKWQAPMDFGKSWRGKRIFGDNKKWRGLVGGVVIGALAGMPIYAYWLPFHTITWFAAMGALVGFGALAGDAIESFFKRQLGKKPGEKWFPFDQIDYILGGILASLVLVRLEFKTYMLVLLIYFGLHLLVSYIGYLLKLKDKPI